MSKAGENAAPLDAPTPGGEVILRQIGGLGVSRVRRARETQGRGG